MKKNRCRLQLTKSNPDLPKEILLEIFSRVPAKDVGKIRCSSKSWKTLLSTPQFIKYHLTRNSHKPNILLSDAFSPFLSVFTPPFSDANLLREFYFLSSNIISSCNGLILLLISSLVDRFNPYELYVINPITLLRKKIPYFGYTSYGFGYDSSTDDYKIVSPYNDRDGNGYMKVYSMRTCTVDSIHKPVGKFRFPRYHYRHQGVFCNGAIHWFSTTYGDIHLPVIGAFDLVNNTFHEVPVPIDIVSLQCSYNEEIEFHLGILEGCLCMVHAPQQPFCGPKKAHLGPARFWVMKEYGNAKSWTKYSVDLDPNSMLHIQRPISFIGYEEILFATPNGELVLFNLKEKKVVDLGVKDKCGGEAFVGSLVSPFF